MIKSCCAVLCCGCASHTSTDPPIHHAALGLQLSITDRQSHSYGYPGLLFLHCLELLTSPAQKQLKVYLHRLQGLMQSPAVE